MQQKMKLPIDTQRCAISRKPASSTIAKGRMSLHIHRATKSFITFEWESGSRTLFGWLYAVIKLWEDDEVWDEDEEVWDEDEVEFTFRQEDSQLCFLRKVVLLKTYEKVVQQLLHETKL